SILLVAQYVGKNGPADSRHDRARVNGRRCSTSPEGRAIARKRDRGGQIRTPPRVLAALDTDPPLRRGKSLPAHGDVLRLHELHQTLVRAFAPDAALLHAAERRGRIRHQPAVEP